MPNPNAIVSSIFGLEPPLTRSPHELLQAGGGLWVLLEDNRRIRLDPANPRSPGLAQIMDGIAREHLLVYLEIDPATDFIERLLIPTVTRVKRVTNIPDGTLQADLEYSEARHLLRADSPDFKAYSDQLRRAQASGAPLIITEDDAHAIIDVRAFVPGPDRPTPPHLREPQPAESPAPSGTLRDLIRRVWHWRHWPWWCWRCLPARRAQAAFDAMSATTCNALTVPPPCIPFLYPDDGCWGRAHEMCRLMIGLGLRPQKVWIQGDLTAATRNNPNCHVNWGWHVAPTLCVRGPRFYQTQPMVIDPALFQNPVSKATWKGVQGDPAATLTDSDASIFYLWGSQTDPTYSKTNQVLATYRLQLQLRSLSIGSPPYAYCP
jgi:hypothetical protein